jgi:hypothetical protein
MRPAIVFALCTVVVSACGTARVYEGPERPRSQVALVVGDSAMNFMTPTNIIITGVDGNEVSAGTNKVEVLPGVHDLNLKCEMLNIGSFNRHKLRFEAVAGKTYKLGVRFVGDKCEGVLLNDR